MFVCGTRSQGPTNITLFSTRVSKGSRLSPCHPPVAHQSPTLASVGPFRCKKTISVLCWKDVLGLHWEAAVVAALEDTVVGARRQRWRLRVSPGHHGEQESAWATSESDQRIWPGPGRYDVLQLSVREVRRTMKILISQRKKLPPQVAVNEL